MHGWMPEIKQNKMKIDKQQLRHKAAALFNLSYGLWDSNHNQSWPKSESNQI